MRSEEIKYKIRGFIIEELLFGYDDGFGDDASFEAEGIIDSTAIFELISYVEQTYGLKIADEEVLPENFDSLSRLSQFIAQKVSE